MGTVNKGDLIRQIAADVPNASAVLVKEIVDDLIEKITAHAEAGSTVAFIGFGKFQVKARPARTGRNPATGQPVDIPESRKITFKPSPKKVA